MGGQRKEKGRRWTAATGVALVLGCAAPDRPAASDDPAPLGTEVSEAGSGEEACPATLTSRQYLETDRGTYLFVEPRAVGYLGEGLLVAGLPTYETTVDPSGRGSLHSANTLFGVVLRADSMATIPIPPGVARLEWVHGARVGTERWGFLFQELEEDAVEPRRGNASEGDRLRYGELTWDGWGPLEELEGVEGWRDGAPFGSLASHPDGVVWSTLLTRNGPGVRVVADRRGPEGWSRMWVDDILVEQVALADGPSGSGWLFLAGPDYDVSGRSVRVHDLEAPDASFRRLRRTRSRVEWLRAVPVGDDVAVAWIQTGVAGEEGVWVAPGALTGDGAPGPVQLDRQGWQVEGAPGPDGRVLWVTQAADPIASITRLRVYRSSSDGSVERLVDIPSPFEGLLSLTLSPTGEIVVVGPEAQLETTTPFVRSLVLRFRLTCPTATAADHLQGR